MAVAPPTDRADRSRRPKTSSCCPRGHAVATATFNTGAVQCNDVVSAETVMMVKERLIEEFGVPAATIGEGRGFGAAQAHLITQNYPGVLDAVVAVEPFPDVVTVLSGAADCVLLQRWYSTPAGSALTPAQQGAINGHATNATCRNWHQRFGGVVDPTTGCDPGIDASQIYEPTTNPGGIRCTIFDQAVNVFGPDPDSGAARRPLDNVGVQYGLNALNAGTISFQQFIVAQPRRRRVRRRRPPPTGPGRSRSRRGGHHLRDGSGLEWCR
jgi:hypothetical protein